MEAAILKELAKFFSWDHAWTVVGLTLLWGVKLLSEVMQRKKHRNTETLDKLVSHLGNSVSQNSVLLTELLFENHFGRPLSWSEICFFRRIRNSAKRLKMFLQCMEYLEVNDTGSKIMIKNGKNLTVRRIVYFLLYTFFGMITFGLLIAFPAVGSDNVAVWLAMTVSMCILSVTALRQGAIATSAYILYEELKADNVVV